MLRVLMRIASPSREAMVPMNTTHSPGEPEQVDRGGYHPGGGGRGGGEPLPPQAGPRARCTRAGGLPLTISGRFSWEILDEMLY